jgi:phospholipid-binding lipoprotein MlaA
MKKLFENTYKFAAISAFVIAVSANTASAASVNIDPTRSSKLDEKGFGEDFDFTYGVEDEVYDPIEPFNRAIFSFNEVVDDFLLEPIARGYSNVVPVWGKKRVGNFLSNLSEPINFVNATLQANDQSAFTSLWRFIINTTFGLLGTFDAATEVGLTEKPESFGETLYVWGITESPYLVLPLFGPSTFRDGVGLGVDYVINPFNYNEILDDSVRTPITVTRVVDTRAGLLPITDQLDSAALDPYVTYRSSYLQNFEKRAKQ